MSFTRLLLLCLASLLFSCQAQRPFVVTNPSQLGDLYWESQLTDSKGNRWEVFILPGIKPMLELGEEGWQTSREFLEKYKTSGYWKEHRELVTMCTDFIVDDCWEFSKDAMVEYGAKGIKEDFKEASENISDNFKQTYFGWIPRIAGNAIWGYIAKPTFRIATVPIGVALGGTGATLGGAGIVALPTGWLVAPAFLSMGSASCIGIILPVSGIAGHQVVFLLVFPNREPAEEHDGEYGLHIINKIQDDDPRDSNEIVEEEIKIVPQKPMKISQEIPKEQFLSKSDIVQMLKEYIKIKEWEIKRIAKLKKMKHLDFSPGAIYAVSQKPFYLDKKAKEYVQQQLKKDFKHMWKKLLIKLSKEEKSLLESEEKAYRQFDYLFH